MELHNSLGAITNNSLQQNSNISGEHMGAELRGEGAKAKANGQSGKGL